MNKLLSLLRPGCILTSLIAIGLLLPGTAPAQTRRATTPAKRTTTPPPATLRSEKPAPATAPTPAPAYQSAEPQRRAPTQQATYIQERSISKSGVFKLNVFSPIVSTVSAFYEKPLSPTSSAQLGFYYTGASVGDVRLRGFGITPEYRFYLSKSTSAPDGAYLAPFVRFQSLTFTDVTDRKGGVQFTSLGGGLLIGRQWLLGRRDNVALDLFLGPSYSAVGAAVEGSAVPSVVSGFGVRFGLALGLAW